MSKILIHSIAFSPDGVSTAYLYNDIALKFREVGYDVVVITTTPHFNVINEDLTNQKLEPKFFGLYYKSLYNNIPVYHVPQKKFKNSTMRIIGFIYWHILAFFLALSQKGIDLILSPSPPLSIAVINILIAKIKKTKVIYNVQEIYPDLLIESGGLKSNIVISVLKRVEKLIYNKSDAITTIDKVFYDTILSRFSDKTRLSIIPNFVDTHIYKPVELNNTNNIDINIFPETKSLKLMYAGNIGHAQDWITLIELAKDLKDHAFEFFIIGEGVMRDFIEKEISINKLNKVHLIKYQPRHLMPYIIAYSDLQFIFMSKETEGHGFPSKVYTIMACGKPLIVCSGKNTPIVNFLKEREYAFLVTESEIDVKVNKLTELLINVTAVELKNMGKGAQTEILNNYSKEKVTSMYINLANSLL